MIHGGKLSVGLNVALMGDSLTDPSYGLTTFFGINAKCGGKMVLLANSGISGNTVGNMLSRVNNSYSASPPGMAGLGSLGRIFVRAGTNDARGNIAIASLASPYTSLLNALATYAQKVIILAVPPLSDAGNNATAATYNAWLNTFASSNPGIFQFIDDCVNLRLGDGAQDPACFNVDGVHLNGTGVARAAASGASVLSSAFAGIASPLSKDVGDVYPAQPQWFVNPTMSGTGGAKDSAFSGTVATGVYVGSYGAGMGGICSIVAADAGDSNQTPWQRVELTSGNAGSHLDIQSTLSGRSITSVDPVLLDALVEIRFNALDRSRIYGVHLMGQTNTGEYIIPQTPIYLDNSGYENGVYVIRARQARSGGSSATYLGWHLYADVASTFSTSVGSIDLRCATVRG